MGNRIKRFSLTGTAYPAASKQRDKRLSNWYGLLVSNWYGLLVSNWHGVPGSVKGNRMHHKWNRVRAALEGQGLVERVEFRRDDRKVP